MRLHLTMWYGFFRGVMDGPFSIWVDNFSKIYNQRFPSADRFAYRDCLWAAMAFRQYHGPTIDMKFAQDLFDADRPAMPDDLFNTTFKSTLWAMFRNEDQNGVDYLERSLCKRFNIRTIPIKIVPDAQQEPNLAAKLLSSPDGLTSFFPYGLIQHNIGSNEGLLRILNQLYHGTFTQVGEPAGANQAQDATRLRKYRLLFVDMNIQIRIMQVLRLLNM